MMSPDSKAAMEINEEALNKAIDKLEQMSPSEFQDAIKGADEWAGLEQHIMQDTQAEEVKSPSKDFFLEIIEEWQSVWMNQRQNSEADYQNYYRRAFGVDANMRHSLARMLAEKFRPSRPGVA